MHPIVFLHDSSDGRLGDFISLCGKCVIGDEIERWTVFKEVLELSSC